MTQSGKVEKLVSPPPHNVNVRPRHMEDGRVIYPRRCPHCGELLIRRPSNDGVRLVGENAWSKGV
jgi:hypothetical protein